MAATYATGCTLPTIAAASTLILRAGGRDEVYNIGGGCELRNIDLVRRLCTIADQAFRSQPALRARFPRSPASSAVGCAGSITFVQDRPGHDRRYAIDSNKLERQIGFHCNTAVERLLQETFDWYAQNESWWRGILDGSYRALNQPWVAVGNSA